VYLGRIYSEFVTRALFKVCRENTLLMISEAFAVVLSWMCVIVFL